MTSGDDPRDIDKGETSVHQPDLDTRPTNVWVDEEAEAVKLDLPDWFGEDQRYQRMDRIGEGGMGEVWACEDRRIGRRVAMKTVHPRLASNQEYTTRFVREALVQGQLEHPSVVPVYDIGVDENGASFFTMKRVRGVSLDRIVGQLARDPGAGGRFTRRRLLSAFSNACLAVDFAHQRGVIHRDLKPANIMLGDYGEVYVLDWGIAKMRSDSVVPPREKVTLDGPDVPRSAATRGVVGTVGYMSPEQLQGALEANEPASDVYALGAILFELLALVPLHPMDEQDAIDSTLSGIDARPSVRAPQRGTPPELDAVCERATALDGRERTPSARELHEAIERFLDGERNEALRRDMAQKHARSAAEAIDGSHAGADLPLVDRENVLRKIGSALALDPSNEQAVSSLITLLSEPPKQMPDEVRRQLDASQARELKGIGIVAGVAYLSMALYLPLFLWSGVRSVEAIVVFYILCAISGILSFSTALGRRPSVNVALAASFTSTLGMASMATLFGSLVVTPALVAANATGYTIFLRGWRRIVATLFACAVIGVAVLLELWGIPWSAYSFGQAGMTIAPGAIGLSAEPTMVFLFVMAISTLLTPTIAVSRIRDNLAQAEAKLSMQGWQIRQLAPGAADVGRGAEPGEKT